MTVISVVRDPDARTMTITARFDAPIGRVWLLWSDPRQPERWWGPAGLSRDGDGARPRTGRHRGLQMDITTAWASVEAMEQMLAMGMEAGMTAAAGQIDELLGLPARA